MPTGKGPGSEKSAAPATVVSARGGEDLGHGVHHASRGDDGVGDEGEIGERIFDAAGRGDHGGGGGGVLPRVFADGAGERLVDLYADGVLLLAQAEPLVVVTRGAPEAAELGVERQEFARQRLSLAQSRVRAADDQRSGGASGGAGGTGARAGPRLGAGLAGARVRTRGTGLPLGGLTFPACDGSPPALLWFTG